MRLLRQEGDTLTLTGDLPEGQVPPYAILSHTWGDPNDEITYADMTGGMGLSRKHSYRKLQFCAQQAARDGLTHFWIDTCCIDKGDLNELTRSINSMFRWYKNSAKCYVYLADVSIGDDTDTDTTWLPAFCASKWFTRAWTLQEILAPACVEFFTKEGTLLGDKNSLERIIHEVTVIPPRALRNASLSSFTIEDRFRWTQKRQATIEEDLAYCLFGIFGIFLPLIYGEGRASAERRLKIEILRARDAAEQWRRPSTLRTCLIPYDRNNAFTGRKAELQQLYRMLVSERRADQTARIALTGLGGIGKTQIAVEFLYQTKPEHEHILWMDGATDASLAESYADAAMRMGILHDGTRDSNESMYPLVHNFLSRQETGSWIMVFDNVDDDDMWFNNPCSRSLPRHNRGSILFTTRNTALAVRAAGRDIISIQEMGIDDSKKLLKLQLNEGVDGGNDEKAATTELLERLTRLPLAIVQAAMYINEHMMDMEDYISLLDEQETDVVQLLSSGFEDEAWYSNSNSARHPVAETWLISFRQIQKRSPMAIDWMSFMACIDSRNIPSSLLPPVPSQRIQLETLGLLKAYGFIRQPSSRSLINMHRLVYLATRNWLRMENRLEQFTDNAVERVADKLLRVTLEDRAVWREYIPHALHLAQAWVVDPVPKVPLPFPEKASGLYQIFLTSRCGHCLYLEGRYAEAEPLLRYAFYAWHCWRDTTHFQTRDVLNNLALVREMRGDLNEAGVLYTAALPPEETRGQSLSNEDRQVASIWGNLIGLYGKLSWFEQAEAQSAQLIQAMTRAFGAEDAQTLGVINNLAGLYHTQGKYADAIQLHKQILETRQRVCGPDDANTIISMCNLASSHRENGQPQEAERLYYDAVTRLKSYRPPKKKTKEEEIPREGPPGWIHTANVAGMDKQGSPVAMELRELLNSRMMGSDHPVTLMSMHGLALTWRGGDRDTEAKEKMQHCAEARARVLGEDHPDTLASLAALNYWDDVAEGEGAGKTGWNPLCAVM